MLTPGHGVEDMSLKRRVANLVRRAADYALDPVLRSNESNALLLGRMNARTVAAERYDSIQQAEFRVFSQWGEDGIIQYLINKVAIADRSFIEFGVESYAESNTRFLLVNDNWRGLILDGGTRHVEFTERRQLRWRHTLDAKSAFVTRENVNSLFESAGFSGDLGLLSIDIDGNDYWVWEAIQVVDPRIVVVEYNATFGPDLQVSVPYEAQFERTRAHSSTLYWGVSLGALCHLADRKGYQFVGSNSAGNNAFFVRRDVAGGLPALSSRDGYVEARFRESRDADGRLTYITSRAERLRTIADQTVVDVATGKAGTIRAIFASEL
jgi:hypothetical protein